ncbi:hypothetical protein B5F40_00895 [Gordonibacter sp. An230]|uniref:helix-turn-helix transcriptional regulator n=1 Tax=Gordonibacter sp. An230 TaxID=1965592 RepID=UPI000B387237|nr:helix-turn-helix transcriptional regulator [Gordonibacter sp. An230]OUO92486.1 hypothetical protein B5F40_00895 [Gordonibacter sp. An230]
MEEMQGMRGASGEAFRLPSLAEMRLAIGFGLFHGWLIAMLTYFGVPSFGFGSALPAGLFLIGGAGGALLGAFVSQRHIRLMFFGRDVLLVLSSCGLFVAVAVPGVAASAACCVVGGVLCGLLHCSYGLATLAFSKASYVRIISLATVVASAVALLSLLAGVGSFPIAAQAAVVLALQLLSNLLLKDSLEGRFGGFGAGASPPVGAASSSVPTGAGCSGSVGAKDGSTGRFLRLMLAVFLFGIVSRGCDAFSLSSYTGVLFSSLALFSSHIVAAVLMVVFVGMKTRSRDLSLFYRFALPCAGAGFVLLALPLASVPASSFFAVFLVGVGYESINLTAWVLTSYAAKVSAAPARYFGLYAAVTYLSMLAGKALSYSLAPVAGTAAAFVGLVCVVVLVVIAFVVLPEDQVRLFEGSLRLSDDERAEGEAFAERCRLFAAAYGLTERETEVMGLLAKGRTLRVIADRLTISKGTAGTHISNIYRKTDVHKQQDLIDLFEAFSR